MPKACSTVFMEAFSGLRATGMTFNCVISDVWDRMEYELVVPNEKQITKKNSIRTKEKNDGIAKIQRVYSGSSGTRFETIGAERFRRGDR